MGEKNQIYKKMHEIRLMIAYKGLRHSVKWPVKNCRYVHMYAMTLNLSRHWDIVRSPSPSGKPTPRHWAPGQPSPWPAATRDAHERNRQTQTVDPVARIGRNGINTSPETSKNGPKIIHNKTKTNNTHNHTHARPHKISEWVPRKLKFTKTVLSR